MKKRKSFVSIFVILTLICTSPINSVTADQNIFSQSIESNDVLEQLSVDVKEENKVIISSIDNFDYVKKYKGSDVTVKIGVANQVLNKLGYDSQMSSEIASTKYDDYLKASSITHTESYYLQTKNGKELISKQESEQWLDYLKQAEINATESKNEQSRNNTLISGESLSTNAVALTTSASNYEEYTGIIRIDQSIIQTSYDAYKVTASFQWLYTPICRQIDNFGISNSYTLLKQSGTTRYGWFKYDSNTSGTVDYINYGEAVGMKFDLPGGSHSNFRGYLEYLCWQSTTAIKAVGATAVYGHVISILTAQAEFSVPDTVSLSVTPTTATDTFNCYCSMQVYK